VGPKVGLEGSQISLPSEFDPRAFQPVVSDYTVCAIPANKLVNFSVRLVNVAVKCLFYLVTEDGRFVA